MNEMDGAKRYVWETGDMNTVLVGRPEGKKPLGKPRHRWWNKSKMDL